MKNLKLKNAVYPVLSMACFFTLVVILLSLFCIIVTYFAENTRDFSMIYLIGGCIIAGIWGISILSFIFCKTILVTEEKISTYRFGKEKEVFPKEEIIECIYTKSAWYMFIFALASFNMFTFLFKMKEKGISRKYLMLSYKQVKMIQENFDYPIRIINSIKEQ